MKYKVTLNNRTYEVEVDEDKAMLVDEYQTYAPTPAPAPISVAAPVAVAPTASAVLASAPIGTAAGAPVTSPMPGNILQILVSQGQQVNEGDTIIILEAMKMENEIVAPKSGIVAQILVTKGATVETGATLAVIA